MPNRKQKSDIPEEVFNYCIDNKLTMKDGLVAMIEEKFDALDTNIKSLKRDVVDSMEEDMRVSDDDMKDVEDFLNFLDKNNPE